MTTGIVSGYFNPLHQGHLEYVEAAKSQCDYLVVIVNNDQQVELKGSKKFMNVDHRCKIMAALKAVDCVRTSIDTDRTICQSLRALHNEFSNYDLVFFNSGDRIGGNVESAEVILCRELGIKYVAIPLPKVYSSSELLKIS
jgi:glycerol-3-phosphate cytidylyltransferase/D-beta-D-heptose 7-phosphate kinase/D-beta-D-heptose 1-phosphate adenosyltransferase